MVSELPLIAINPYTFDHSGSVINLRENIVIGNRGHSTRLSNSIGYTGSINYRNADYRIIIANQRTYLILPTSSFSTIPLSNTNEIGTYNVGSFVLDDGTEITVRFNIEARNLIIEFPGGLISFINMRPFVAYKFSDTFGTYYALVNNCDVALDCTDDSHCEEGEVCSDNNCRIQGGGVRIDIGGLFGNRNNWFDPNTFMNLVNTCQNNNDCTRNERCSNGVCNVIDEGDEGTIQGVCASNSDCPAGESCNEGVCAISQMDEEEDNLGGNNGGAGGQAGAGGGSSGGGGGGGGGIGPSRCVSDSSCTSDKYCLNGACIEKDSISKCHRENGVACNMNDNCRSSNGKVMGSIRCCIGENNACLRSMYNPTLKSRVIVTTGDCNDNDNNGKGTRQITLCYPDSENCTPDSTNVIPAVELGIDTNPYYEECVRPTKEDLKVPMSLLKKVIIISGIVLGILIILGSIISFIIYKKKNK